MSINSNEKVKKRIPEKEFKIRNSLLTERYKNEDIKTIYNIFVVILLSLLVNTVIHDYTKKGQFHFGLRLILFGFNKFGIAVIIWCLQNLIAGAVYLVFGFWAKTRSAITPKLAKFWDNFFIIILVFHYFASLYGVQKAVEIFEFNPGSATILVLEQLRLLMKQHSFIRSNAPKILTFKPHSDKILKIPKFTQYVYFFFAPTLLYRDEYPRTERVRWKFVFFNALEVLIIVFLLSLVIERLLIPPFEDFGLRKFSKGELVINIVGNAFPGILFILGGFYSVLHATQNAFAELLRFGDRLFYKEWWIAQSLSEWYRTWNIVVHDWLFTYIYKDMYEIVVPKNKTVARVAVFLISALIHEWVLTICLRLFLPIQFVEFFLTGALLSYLNILDFRIGNLAMWYALVFGSGTQVNMYALEYIARMNCAKLEEDSVYNFFVPRFLTCNAIK